MGELVFPAGLLDPLQFHSDFLGAADKETDPRLENCQKDPSGWGHPIGPQGQVDRFLIPGLSKVRWAASYQCSGPFLGRWLTFFTFSVVAKPLLSKTQPLRQMR